MVLLDFFLSLPDSWKYTFTTVKYVHFHLVKLFGRILGNESGGILYTFVIENGPFRGEEV